MQLLLFCLLVVAALACALIATSAARRCSELLNEARSMTAALSSERSTLAALSGEIDTLGTAFAKLSGRIAALKRWDRIQQAEPADSMHSGAPSVPSAQATLAEKAAWKGRMREKLLVNPRK
jgi:hypothetical protein